MLCAQLRSKIVPFRKLWDGCDLLLLFGEQSRLPFYYRKVAGNITDVKTVERLLDELDMYELKKTKLVMDRGFYSENNINALYSAHKKFLIGLKIT